MAENKTESIRRAHWQPPHSPFYDVLSPASEHAVAAIPYYISATQRQRISNPISHKRAQRGGRADAGMRIYASAKTSGCLRRLEARRRAAEPRMSPCSSRITSEHKETKRQRALETEPPR
ncbi:unnamed protein product [Pleuronectes platessa]|uniref:Uncharacterized protein n=1 Tax=Pleuronectes platessa TaxID=8262 RepID=A0A9N7Z0B1_PLEPL|nr:unnamed protein product [Pleuronectes platessa]